MPKMYGEKFPYPRSGAQPQNSNKLNSPSNGPANIPGGANDNIYLPEVSRVANTGIYLKQNTRVSGGVNDIYMPDNKAL
jgi:hypothetical protein